MSIYQVSVFTQSQPGHLLRILNILAEEELNVRGFSCSDSGDFGIARFVLDEPQKALDILQAKGFAAAMTEILVFELHDTPGELQSVVSLLANDGLNIVYSYSLISTCVAIRVKEVDRAKKLLQDNGVALVTQETLAEVLR
ncbi:MAG: amino acid-binding protein [Eggerthellaceae bacterium]|nr:amino acid-binding protein [Eggerthellaceae bacterium]